MIDIFRMSPLLKWFRFIQMKFRHTESQEEQYRSYIEQRLAALNHSVLHLLAKEGACLSEKSLLREQLFLTMRSLEVDHLASIELRLQAEGKFSLCIDKLTSGAQDTIKTILNLMRKKLELDIVLEAVYMQLESFRSDLIDTYLPMCSNLPTGNLRQHLEWQLSELLSGVDGKENRLFDAYVYTIAHSNEEIKWLQLILFGVPLPKDCFQMSSSILACGERLEAGPDGARQEMRLPYSASSTLSSYPAGWKLSDAKRLSLVIERRFNRLRTYFMEELALEAELQNQTSWLQSWLNQALVQL